MINNKPSSILFFITILVLTINLSCVKNQDYSRFSINKFTIGDTILSDFIVTEILDFPYSNAIYKKDERLSVFLINNHIYRMIYNELTDEEFEEFKNQITNKLRIDPTYFKDYFYGVKINGESYKWNDTLSGDIIALGRDSASNVLIIDNEKVTMELISKYIPGNESNKEEIEIYEE